MLTIVGAAVLLLEVSPGAATGGALPASTTAAEQNLAIIVNQANTVTIFR